LYVDTRTIAALVGHFHAVGTFKSVFIRTLVPWNDLVGEPNQGHAAVADLLVCRAAHAALSANFDPLIKQWSERRKIAMQGALTGTEAVEFSNHTSPLLKFDGRPHRGRADTLWTLGQLGEADVQSRVASCSHWMNLHLPGKDLLIVGFWTDWGYLNGVLANAFAVQDAASVTVVDISSQAEPQAKAPDLWQKGSTPHARGLNETACPGAERFGYAAATETAASQELASSWVIYRWQL
jgi:hypothetical protein